MAKLKIYEYPHPILKKKAEPVKEVTDELRKLMDDMLDTMNEIGVGLAAPQVGVSKRIILVNAAPHEEEDYILYMVNPVFVSHSEDLQIGEEGCLSVPGQTAEVERFEKIKIRYLDYDGKEQILEAEDYLAVVIQHEMDHLDGVLYIDHLSRLKRNMLVKKLEKFRKEMEEEQKS